MPGVVIQSPHQTDIAALAEAAFVNVPSLHPETSYVCVGDTIDTDQQEGFLRYSTVHGCCRDLLVLELETPVTAVSTEVTAHK